MMKKLLCFLTLQLTTELRKWERANNDIFETCRNEGVTLKPGEFNFEVCLEFLEMSAQSLPETAKTSLLQLSLERLQRNVLKIPLPEMEVASWQ